MHKYYKVLGLPYDAPLSELKQAYHALVRIWHPDRFAHNEQLAERAHKKLTEINEAYRFLRSLTPEDRKDESEHESPVEPIDWSVIPKTGQTKTSSSRAKQVQNNPSKYWHWSYNVVGVPLIGLGIIFWLSTKPTQTTKTSPLLPPPVPIQYAIDDDDPETPTPSVQQVSNSQSVGQRRDTTNSLNDSLKLSPADGIHSRQ